MQSAFARFICRRHLIFRRRKGEKWQKGGKANSYDAKFAFQKILALSLNNFQHVSHQMFHARLYVKTKRGQIMGEYHVGSSDEDK